MSDFPETRNTLIERVKDVGDDAAWFQFLGMDGVLGRRCGDVIITLLLTLGGGHHHLVLDGEALVE